MPDPQLDKDGLIIDGSIIDIEQLKGMFGDDEETIHELLNFFVASTPNLLGQLKGAINQSDLKAVAGYAHQLAGSSSSVGMVEFSQIARKIEQAAKQEDVDAVKLNTPSIESAYEKICGLVHRLTATK